MKASVATAAAPDDAPSPCRTMQLRSGAMFDPLAPDPAMILPSDIAHALAHLCRFGGHVSRFLSVAEHSVHVSLCAEGLLPRGTPDAERRQAALLGLLHDATEAYLGDTIWPLKHSPAWAWYREAEARLDSAIRARFGLSFVDPVVEDAVDWADAAVLLGEARDLMGDPPWARERVGRPGMEPYPPAASHGGSPLVGWAPPAARGAWIARWRELTGEGVGA